MNTGMLIEMAADGLGDRIALGSRKDGLSYAGLFDQARRVATVVAGSGAERVVFVAQNSARLPALVFGSGLAGVPFVPVNYRLADEQLCAIRPVPRRRWRSSMTTPWGGSPAWTA